jgi:MFS family permease
VYPAWRIGVLGLMALLMLLPVTLPVPVLRELVAERFGVSELLTSLFMSINMVGAVLAAPLAGALADRFGQRPRWIAAALALDALCFLGLTRDVPFAGFLAIRFVEGAAHIFALSLLLGLASGARPETQRGLVMGATGSGLLLGVASGAPLGGRLGHPDPLLPLYVGAAVVAAAALLALLGLRETQGRERERPGLGEIARLVRASPIVAIPLLFAFADRFTVGFFTSTFPLMLRNLYGLPPARIGLLIAVFMLPFAALSFPFGILSQRTSRAFVLCGGSLAYGCLVASLGFWPSDALLGVMLATGSAAAVMFVPSMLFTVDATPDSVRTTSMGAFNAAGSLGFIAGPVTGGLVSQSVAASFGWEAGYSAAFGVAGGFKILLALAAFVPIRRFERRRRTQ